MKTPLERFTAHISIGDWGDYAGISCWEWRGIRDKDGYGRCHLYVGKKRERSAHRIAYILFIGPIPANLHVLHACDNPWCVNPKHLFLGTARDNIDDMMKKGRSLAGERHPHAKLTEQQVQEIRAAHIERPTGSPKGLKKRKLQVGSSRWLAKKYGVTRSLIQFIIKGKAWATSEVAPRTGKVAQ